MMITKVISKILLGQVDKSPIKTELAQVAKENAEICNITLAKPR